MKDKILFVCIGQGGSNIGQLFENRKYNCLFVNSAYTDLVPIEAKHKLHIVGTEGCNKDRRKAVQYIQESYKMIENTVNTKFPMQDIVFFMFSMGGGTGSGFSPLLIDYFVNKYPKKHFGAIPILPNKNEGLKAQMNAVECFNELKGMVDKISIDLLDNNNARPTDRNYERFNKMFFERFDRLVNMTIPDKRGIVDGAELVTTLTCKGSRYIEILPKIDGEVVDFVERLEEKLERNTYTAFENKKCKYITMSLVNEVVDEGKLQEYVGTPLDTFKGYNDSFNIIAFSGQMLPMKVANDIYENIKKINLELMTLKEREKQDIGKKLTIDEAEIESIFESVALSGDRKVVLGVGDKEEKEDNLISLEIEEIVEENKEVLVDKKVDKKLDKKSEKVHEEEAHMSLED